MPDEAPNRDDSPNRATVALVAEMVKGLRDLSAVEFDNIKQRLEPLAGLPVVVERLKGRLDSAEHRIAELEGAAETEENRSFTLRKIHVPALIVSAVLVLVSLGDLIVQLTQSH